EMERVEETIHKLIARHENLRTSFIEINGTPFQKIREKVEFKIEYYTGESIRDFCRPFDLYKAPIMRVGLITKKEPTGQNYLLVDMHHIITDRTSRAVLAKEFFALAAGESLSPLRLQYKDYAEWQNSRTQTRLLKQQEEFWTKEFPGEIPVLNLPTDYPRPLMQSFEGSSLRFILDKEETKQLNETAGEKNTTLFMMIISILTILLSKLGSQEDIVIGTPTAGRRHADLENIIGMFVNTLPLRNYPSGQRKYREYLREVKEHTLEAFENQEYQFEDLVDKIAVSRDLGRNPIFDVMFNLQDRRTNKQQNNMQEEQGEGDNRPGGSGGNPEYGEPGNTSLFDLTLNGYESGDKMVFGFQYCTKLFKEETIRRFITYFKGILKVVCGSTNQKIAEIEIITEEEKRQILYEFNDTAAEYPRDKTIHQLFEEQVEKTPDSIG
ncbi:MAG: non-ribosomal peptide synthetase, partial [bacterium]|nr:non-ribosomal peptide synthetase [bacterium]